MRAILAFSRDSRLEWRLEYPALLATWVTDSMVDKIDRPEPPPAYRVVATAGAKDEQGQSQAQSQQDDEFSSPGTPAEWRKLHGRMQDRTLLRLRREDIRHVSFRRAIMQSRAGILETDVELTNGQMLQHAQFLIPRLDEFLHWKGYLPGQDLPLPALLREPYIEVSVPQGGSVTRDAGPVTRQSAPPTRQDPQPWWQIQDPHTGVLRRQALWIAIAIAVGIVVLAAVL